MKIYFAGSWYRKNELKDIRDKVLALDPTLTVVSSWLDDPDAPHDNEGKRAYSVMQKDALRDSFDVLECDLLVIFTSNKPEYQVGGGRFWEFGRAYTLQKGCIVVGPQEQIFENMPLVGYLDDEEQLFDIVSRKGLAHKASMEQVWRRKVGYL